MGVMYFVNKRNATQHVRNVFQSAFNVRIHKIDHQLLLIVRILNVLFGLAGVKKAAFRQYRPVHIYISKAYMADVSTCQPFRLVFHPHGSNLCK